MWTVADVPPETPRGATLPVAGPTDFDQLYRTAYQPMVRLAYLLTGGDSVAEDLVQDAFVAVHRRLTSIDDAAAYLRVAVVNRCRSHGRRRALERRLLPRRSEAVEDHPDELRDVIRRLPERQRTAVVLRYYEDMSEADIARTLGCRVPAVKSLLFRALKDMRKVVER
jgi:RNA polymerase sigma-70 factor (sigma-E family)